MNRSSFLLLCALLPVAAIACSSGSLVDSDVDRAASADTAALSATCLVPREHPANGAGTLWFVDANTIDEGSVVYWRGFPVGGPEREYGFSITSDDVTNGTRVVVGRHSIIAGDQIVTVTIRPSGATTIELREPAGSVVTTEIANVYACNVRP